MLDVRWLMCADRRLLPNVVILLAPLSVFHRSSTWRKAKDERLVTRDNNAASHMTRLTLFSPYRFLIEKYLRWLDSCTTWPNAWKQLSNCNWYICFCFFFFCALQSGNEDPDEVLLDSEMDKVFAGNSARKDKFDVNTFQDNSQLPIGSRKKNSSEYPSDKHNNISYLRMHICSPHKRSEHRGGLGVREPNGAFE